MVTVGLDLHKRYITACALDESGTVLAEHRRLEPWVIKRESGPIAPYHATVGRTSYLPSMIPDEVGPVWSHASPSTPDSNPKTYGQLPNVRCRAQFFPEPTRKPSCRSSHVASTSCRGLSTILCCGISLSVELCPVSCQPSRHSTSL
jgi:hypothetical protein